MITAAATSENWGEKKHVSGFWVFPQFGNKHRSDAVNNALIV